MDFKGFDSSTVLISRGGISRPIGNFPESLTRAMLVGTMLEGRLGVFSSWYGLYFITDYLEYIIATSTIILFGTYDSCSVLEELTIRDMHSSREAILASKLYYIRMLYHIYITCIMVQQYDM